MTTGHWLVTWAFLLVMVAAVLMTVMPYVGMVLLVLLRIG